MAQPKIETSVAFDGAKGPGLNIGLIRQAIWDHYCAEKQKNSRYPWPSRRSGSVLYGYYAHTRDWSYLDDFLKRNGSSLLKLKQDLAAEHGLEYPPLLTIDDVKATIWAQYEATESFNGEGPIENGTLTGWGTWGGLANTVNYYARKYPDAWRPWRQLKREVAAEHSITYTCHPREGKQRLKKVQEEENEAIMQAMEAHRQASEAINQAGETRRRAREARRCEQETPARSLKSEHGIKVPKIKIDDLHESVFAYHSRTGRAPTEENGIIQDGPLAGKATWKGVKVFLL